MDGASDTPSLTPQWLLVGSRPPGAGGAPVRCLRAHEKKKSRVFFVCARCAAKHPPTGRAVRSDGSVVTRTSLPGGVAAAQAPGHAAGV